MAETETTTETKVTFGDLKKAVLAFFVTVSEVGNFNSIDEKGNEVIGGGAPFAELKEFAAYDTLKALADKIAESQDRGTPLESKLEKVQNEQGEHYASVKVVDGKPQFTPEWMATNETLTARINSLKGQIARRDRELKKQAEEQAAAEKAKLDAENAAKNPPAPEKKDAKA